LQPLLLQEGCTDVDFYFEERSQEDEDDIGDLAEYQPMNKDWLKTDIEEWCTTCTTVYADLQQDARNHPDQNKRASSLVTALRQTVHHLPRSLEDRPYSLIRSIKIYPLRLANNVVPKICPSSLLTVNLIQVNLPKVMVSSQSLPCLSKETRDAAMICSGFDLTCCCVSLLTNDDHTYQTVTFEDAAVDLKQKTLRLRPIAFAGGDLNKAVVPVQMRRIKKYMARSFTWS